jgi:hypothetical protein
VQPIYPPARVHLQLHDKFDRLLRATKRLALNVRTCELHKLQFMVTRLHTEFAVIDSLPQLVTAVIKHFLCTHDRITAHTSLTN